MTPDAYLQSILQSVRVDTGPSSIVRNVQNVLQPAIGAWANVYLVGVTPSGSFAKGTAVKSGTDIDLFVSLSSSTPEGLKEIYESLFDHLRSNGFSPRQQNVSIGVNVSGISVDIVPAKRHDQFSDDHSIYRTRTGTWTKTNVITHVSTVRNANRNQEIMILKTWRNQRALDFPSFYLELATIRACRGRLVGSVASNVLASLEYFRDRLEGDAIVDPANGDNRVSDDVSAPGKQAIAQAARQALSTSNWNEIVR